MDIVNILKQDSEQAAIRIVSTQVLKAVRAGLATSLRNKGADESVITGMLQFLDTDVGTGLISVLLGHLLPHAPVIGTDPRVELISKEFRIAGMANTGNAIIGEVVQHILPGVSEALKQMPQIPSVRIDAPLKEAEVPTTAQSAKYVSSV
jgi:hypothetical protein